jgi:electron transfer flavoprotein alpha subunit
MAAGVWIVLQQRDGRLHRMAWEAIAAGQQLATAEGQPATAVLLGSGVEGLAKEVAGRTALAAVRVADTPGLAAYTPGAYVAALAPAIQSAAPRFVVFPHTYQTVDYMPRLAQQVGAALVPEVLSFERAGEDWLWKRPVLGGKLHARVRVRGGGTSLLSVQSGAFPADGLTAGSAPVEELAADLSAVTPDREILGVEEVGGDTVDLAKADVIVAVGRGIGGGDKLGPVRELAAALGAEIGASRPVIDNGWLPRDRQIGSSGQTVAPRLYIAAGISGAIQHLVGMKGSACVVAINKDPGAPIFTVAHYGIVGDVHDVIPALTAAINEVKARG